MKISEMETEKACDVLVNISEAVSNIACDDDVVEVITKMQDPEEGKTNIIVFFGKYAKIIIPKIFKTHRDDLYTIIHNLTDKPFSVISKQPLKVTIEDITSSIDGELTALFTQAVK